MYFLYLQMSKYYQTVPYTYKHKARDWVNTHVSVHDIYCSCNKPLEHIVLGIFDQEPNLRFDSEDKQKIQKCLTTTEDGDALDGFGDGELEKLFEEDIGEPDTATENDR